MWKLKMKTIVWKKNYVETFEEESLDIMDQGWIEINNNVIYKFKFSNDKYNFIQHCKKDYSEEYLGHFC